jgi:hypothetical protein
MQKLSVTVDDRVAEELKARVRPREVSQFVSRAIDHELERARLRELLDRLEAELGPPDPGLVRTARAAFDRAEAAGRSAQPRARAKRRAG